MQDYIIASSARGTNGVVLVALVVCGWLRLLNINKGQEVLGYSTSTSVQLQSHPLAQGQIIQKAPSTFIFPILVFKVFGTVFIFVRKHYFFHVKSSSNRLVLWFEMFSGLSRLCSIGVFVNGLKRTQLPLICSQAVCTVYFAIHRSTY